MKYASLWTAGAKVNTACTKGDRSSTCGKGTLPGQPWGHFVAWQFVPVLAIFGAHDQEFAVERIAQRHTMRPGVAIQGIEEKPRARVGVLQCPRRAAVGRLVDTGPIAIAARHRVGNIGIKALDIAEIKRARTCHAKLLPGFAVVGRTQNHAVRARSPDGVVQFPLAASVVVHAYAAQIGVQAAGLNRPTGT